MRCLTTPFIHVPGWCLSGTKGEGGTTGMECVCVCARAAMGAELMAHTGMGVIS